MFGGDTNNTAVSAEEFEEMRNELENLKEEHQDVTAELEEVTTDFDALQEEYDTLNNNDNGYARLDAHFFKILPWIPSGPLALLELILDNN